ncbi:MAG TPA: TonB-dependent receptor plug domain-containing protein, partial [Puia sp.]|nr:TonB-dependent receptor plug domain-containing protein [Puia sp.]
MSGVTILVKGTQSQALSDDKGLFQIAAEPTATLEFTHIGYGALDTAVAGEAVSIVMRQSQGELTEVVVTALGIRRSQPSLTYATQQVSGDQLTNVKTDNLMNTLNGKVAGLTVSPSASGVGGSAKVILRGNRSASGNNQPLYVIDGIPISNANNANGQPTGTYGGTPDGGDGISNLNPEDIASISVLEGASAAALYGSQAENGVILITTKRGRPGVTQINFNSSIFADQVAYKPKFQNSFGETTSNSTDSWGSAINGGHDNLNDFFRTAMNWTNSISLSGGSEKAQTYFSYANTDATGVQPNNKLQRNNLTLHETARLLKDKLTVDGNVSYITQKINNSPALGIYQNPLTGLYLFPRGRDIQPYKNQWLNADSTGFARQNWPINDGSLCQQNPWWITNEEPSVATRNRILFNASLRYEVASWLNIQARGNIDYINDNYEQDLHSGTLPIYNNNGHGRMTISQQTTEQKYGDVIANFNIPMKTDDFKISGIAGTSITDTRVTGNYITGDLSTPDFFTEGNIIASLAGLTSVTTSPATQDVPPGTSSPFP